jgi:hypothetical protein
VANIFTKSCSTTKIIEHLDTRKKTLLNRETNTKRLYIYKKEIESFTNVEKKKKEYSQKRKYVQ